MGSYSMGAVRRVVEWQNLIDALDKWCLESPSSTK